MKPELLGSDSEASEEIKISPTTLQRLSEITQTSVGHPEKEKIKLSDSEEKNRSSNWEPDNEIPFAQLRYQRQTEQAPDNEGELPLKLRLRGAMLLE